ncbi:hypothetical protein PG994_012120 [Apiospora phragmitis]|uniref:Uncharacterized protein n=1 Tax=Apiospora phragmitis TaxID=2905665 RepID=A0ABR1TWY6_9PEZI
MAHPFRGSPMPECTSEGMETTSELATDSVESRSAAIVSAINHLAQHTISASHELSQHSASLSDAVSVVVQRDAVTKSFEHAIQAIRAETYRAYSQVEEALRVSHGLHNMGAADGPISLPGIDPGHEIHNLLSLVGIEGKNFYQLAETNLNMPRIIVGQTDGGTATSITSPTSLLLPTTKNAKILQHAYGRALRHKVDLIKSYITVMGIDNATSAPKRNKPAHEHDTLMTLPQKHRLGTFLDMNMVQPDGISQAKVDDSELVLAFLLPSGGYQYVEVISGNTKDEAGIGETDLVVPVSEDAIKLLYELYCGLKDFIAQRKATASAQGLAQAQPPHDPTDVALFRRMRHSGLDDEDKDDSGSKRMRTSD